MEELPGIPYNLWCNHSIFEPKRLLANLETIFVDVLDKHAPSIHKSIKNETVFHGLITISKNLEDPGIFIRLEQKCIILGSLVKKLERNDHPFNHPAFGY